MNEFSDLKSLHPLSLEVARKMQEETIDSGIPGCLECCGFFDKENNLDVKVTKGLLGLPGFQLLRYKGNLSYFDAFDTPAPHVIFRTNSLGLVENCSKKSIEEFMQEIGNQENALLNNGQAEKERLIRLRNMFSGINLENDATNHVINDMISFGSNYRGFIVYGDKVLYLDKKTHKMIFERELAILSEERRKENPNHWEDLLKLYETDYISYIVMAKILLCLFNMQQQIEEYPLEYQRINDYLTYCKTFSKKRRSEIMAHCNTR